MIPQHGLWLVLTCVCVIATPAYRMTAYASALHEHCTGLLQYGGPDDCMNSIRCLYLKPDGTAVHKMQPKLTNSRSSNLADSATFLASASLAPNSNSSLRSTSPNNDPAFWKQVASAMQLTAPTCVPMLSKLDGIRFTACSWQQLEQPSKPKAAADQLPTVCQSNPKACFVANASLSSDMEAWWLGARPKCMLEDNSSWKDPSRLQRVSQFCADKWAAQAEWVTDVCATRGVGSTPWNNSIMLNRMVVALVDAFESSACNNTVAFSEAMAVQKIVADLCSTAKCSSSGGSPASTQSSAGKARAGASTVAAAAAVAVAAFLWFGML